MDAIEERDSEGESDEHPGSQEQPNALQDSTKSAEISS